MAASAGEAIERTDQAEHAVRTFRVVDDRERELSWLHVRFPALHEQVATEPMRAE